MLNLAKTASKVQRNGRRPWKFLSILITSVFFLGFGGAKAWWNVEESSPTDYHSSDTNFTIQLEIKVFFELRDLVIYTSYMQFSL